MKKIGIFFGSTTGTTESVANTIAKYMGVPAADVHDVSKTAPDAVGDYDVLLFGCSTWGDGDMQDDMQDFMDGVSSLELGDKTVALFGCGDETMTDTFCNGFGEMYRKLLPTHARFIGEFNTDGYDYSTTAADVDGRIVGLLIDNVNHEDTADERIKQWTEKIRTEM